MGNYKYCTRINRQLLPVKIHNFLFFAAIGCAFPFRTIFAKHLGISATAVGIIYCVIPFIKVVTNPLFGFIFDYFKRIRLTLSMIMIFVALSHVAMVFIPPKTSVSQSVFNITDGEFFFKVKYSAVNVGFPYEYEPRLLMYSEYREENNFEKQDRNFTCNLLCSDFSNTVVTSKNFDDKRQCGQNINFEIVVFIDISGCAVNVSLKTAKLLMKRGDENISLLETFNEKPAIHVKSWVFPEDDCSEVVSTPSDSSSFTSLDSVEMKTRLLDKLGVENLTSSISTEGFESTSIPDSTLHDRSFRHYSALNKYDFRVRNNSANFMYNNSILNNFDCPFEFTCQIKVCHSKVKKSFDDSNSEFLTVQFWGLFVLFSLVSTLCSTIYFLMEAVCYEMLQEDRDNYGRQRFWGTVGSGVGGLAGGYLNQVSRDDSGEIDYAPAFYLLAILVVIDLIPVCKLKLTEIKYSSNIWKDVGFIFTKLNFAYHVLMVYAIGVLSGFIWNYQFWFMEEIGSSQVLLGLSQAVESVFEIPFFILSGYIIKKIGHTQCNSVTLLCFGLRYLCFFFMYNPWWTLPAAIFFGPTFGLFYASMTMYAKNEAPAGTEATVQSLLHLFFEGIGVASGSVLGGVGVDNLGCRTSFLCAAVVSFILLITNLFMNIILSRAKRKPPKDKIIHLTAMK